MIRPESIGQSMRLIEQMSGEMEELRRDAERWRHLLKIGIDSKGEFRVYMPSANAFVDAIDAAMKENK